MTEGCIDPFELKLLGFLILPLQIMFSLLLIVVICVRVTSFLLQNSLIVLNSRFLNLSSQLIKTLLPDWRNLICHVLFYGFLFFILHVTFTFFLTGLLFFIFLVLWPFYFILLLFILTIQFLLLFLDFIHIFRKWIRLIMLISSWF